MLQSVLPAYGLEENLLKVESFGSGLINNTWKVTTSDHEYILQRVNNAVFKEPADIANNISLIGSWLREKHPEYNFVSPVVSNKGDEMIYQEGEGYYRMFPFVPGSQSRDVVESPELAYEAAIQFGRFTRLLSGIDIHKIKITIPCFHDLSLRYRQFLQALENSTKQKINESDKLIKELIRPFGYCNGIWKYSKQPGIQIKSNAS